MPPTSCHQRYVCSIVGVVARLTEVYNRELRHSFILPLPPSVAYHSTSLGNDCVKYIWANSNQVPESNLGRLVGDIHVRHSLPSFISIGLFQKKIQRGGEGLMIYTNFLKKPLGIYRCFTLPLENKLSLLEIPHIRAPPLRNSKTKNPRTIENPHDFFLITHRKIHFFSN